MKNHVRKQFVLLVIVFSSLLFYSGCTDSPIDSPDLLESIPETPTELSATALSQTEIELLWTDNSDNET